MPTINALPPAVSVSDTDELVVSQSDVVRSATRAQLLSGVQAALALPSGNLLGRMSSGVGAPEAIAVGANLTVVNGALNAPSPFIVAGLPAGVTPVPGDLVPLGQSGTDSAIPFATFMSGLGNVSGVDGSNITSRATGTNVSRRLADFMSDAVTVETFGALGDGVTDDTAAFAAALATGRPLRLDGRTYIVNGLLQFSTTPALVGVSGATIIRRHFLSSSQSWVSVTSPSMWISGITFDAGSLAGGDMPAVMVASDCETANFVECTFTNAVGTISGCGLTLAPGVGASHTIERCNFLENTLHGISVTGAGNVTVTGCAATANGNAGIRVDGGVSCILRENVCNQNSAGISVGAWMAGGAPQSGTSTCVVQGNIASGNALWGIAVSSVAASVRGNVAQGNGTIATGGGMLARLGASLLAGNLVRGGSVGIDARGSWGCSVSDNHISLASVGLSVGGSQSLTVSRNTFLTNGWGITVSGIEPSLSFLPTNSMTVSENWIGFTSAQGGGISVLDAAQGVAIIANDIHGWGSATIDQALWLHTDAAVLLGNRWNNQARYTIMASSVGGLQALVVPDVADEVLVVAAGGPVASILTSHQADTLGQIAFVKVTAGGSGYSEAQVLLSGTGNGAAATAIVTGGEVAWVVLTNPGSGYGPAGNTVGVTITGDGSGAAATASAGLPVLEGRSLRLSCNCQIQLALTGTTPTQQSWTGYASTIPAFGVVDLEGVSGAWRAVSFPPVDYLTPSGDGGAILQSVGASNLVLRPGAGGALHIANAAEALGCTSTVGRGSPLGMVAAPPGSDFRNLNGGPGQTFWVKQSSTDATGWVAVG